MCCLLSNFCSAKFAKQIRYSSFATQVTSFLFNEGNCLNKEDWFDILVWSWIFNDDPSFLVPISPESGCPPENLWFYKSIRTIVNDCNWFPFIQTEGICVIPFGPGIMFLQWFIRVSGNPDQFWAPRRCPLCRLKLKNICTERGTSGFA